MILMPRPHGGKLVNRLTSVSKKAKKESDAEELHKISVSNELRLDFENIAFGLYSPLKGPLNLNDFESVVNSGRLSNDIPWTIPIVLDITDSDSKTIKEGDSISLESNGELFAVLNVNDKYKWNKEAYNQNIYKTSDTEHTRE